MCTEANANLRKSRVGAVKTNPHIIIDPNSLGFGVHRGLGLSLGVR